MRQNTNLNNPPTVQLSPALQNKHAAILPPNLNNLASGQVGIALALPAGHDVPAGAQQLVTVSLTPGAVTELTTTQVSIVSTPIAPEVVDANAHLLPIGQQNGTVTICYGYEGDVLNAGSVTMADWVEVGRLVSGLDTFYDNTGNFEPGKFQRADCAPRATGGDGIISMADWVQTGRYAAGLDLLTPATGPDAPAGNGAAQATAAVRRAVVPPCVLSVQPTSLRAGVAGTVNLVLTSRGNDTALGFTVNFDPKLLRFTGARLGSGTDAGSLLVNARQAAQGHVGLALTMPIPKTVAAGKQTVIALNFTPLNARPQTTQVSFGDQVITREAVSATADVLPASYTNGVISIGSIR